METKLLSFLVSDSKTVQITCDDEGLSSLIDAITKVRSAGHVHLRSPSCGGTVLSDTTPWGDQAIGEVIITFA